MATRSGGAAWVAAFWAAASLGAEPGPKVAHATRVAAPPVLDGKLDEELWAHARLLDGFTQVYPSEGAPASEQTELRIVYTDRAIYLGVRCLDSNAARLSPRLGRRDNFPETDFVAVAFDPIRDRRSAFFFGASLAGSLSDGLLVEGQEPKVDWDAVWDARVSIGPEGWTVEFEIPFAALALPEGSEQTWGFHIRRYISARTEYDDWSPVKVTDPSFVGKFAVLEGISGVSSGVALHVTPYVAVEARPSFAASSLVPRQPWSPSVGADFRLPLTRSLVLDGTVNPDFGQVEMDPAVVNLSAYETFLPEKRRFFLDGIEIFSSAGPFLYSRRIGAPPPPPQTSPGATLVSLEPWARIYGAAKVTGNLWPGTAVGLLTAYVGGTSAVEKVPVPGGPPELRTLPASSPALFSAARARQVVGGTSALGLIATSVVHPDGAPGASVAAADFDFRGESDFTASGYLAYSVSPACGGERPSFLGGRCDGLGADVVLGKTGGELRLFSNAKYYGAQFDLNDAGFLLSMVGNQKLSQRTVAQYYRPRVLGPLNQLIAETFYETAWNPAAGPAGDWPLVQHLLGSRVLTVLPQGWEAEASYARGFEVLDDVEPRLNPISRLYRRPASHEIAARLKSDVTLPLSAQLQYTASLGAGGNVHAQRLDVTALLGDRVQVGLSEALLFWTPKTSWVGLATDGRPLMAPVRFTQFDVAARVTAAFSRDLTLQLFTQYLRSGLSYETISVLEPTGDLQPCASGWCEGSIAFPPGDLSSVILNAVLRWELRPGTSAYLVGSYSTRGSRGAPALQLGRSLGDVLARPGDAVIAVKFHHLLAL